MVDVILDPFYQKINGILFSGTYSPAKVKEAFSYKPTPEDLFIVTYPKCGTTWMQYAALHIFRKGNELEDLTDYRRIFPFIDREGNEGINNMPRPGALKTHLPFTHVPYSLDAKYIYVLRNPKDCCVSMYYHTKCWPECWEAKFDEFFEIFMKGEVEYNDYFDHLDSWYPHLNDKNVFFTTYETMATNMKDVVLKLAVFLGREYVEVIEKDNNILNNILKFSEFHYMKNKLSQIFDQRPNQSEKTINENLPERVKDALRKKPPPEVENIKFIRKGIVGDWKNHFSEVQSERMNRKFIERTQGTKIRDMYGPFMF